MQSGQWLDENETMTKLMELLSLTQHRKKRSSIGINGKAGGGQDRQEQKCTRSHRSMWMHWHFLNLLLIFDCISGTRSTTDITGECSKVGNCVWTHAKEE